MQKIRAVAEVVAVLEDWMTAGDSVPELAERLRTCAGVLDGRDDLARISVSEVRQRHDVALDLARQEGVVTTRALSERSYCSYETARQLLVDLARRGILRGCGKGKGKHYIPGFRFPGAVPSLGKGCASHIIELGISEVPPCETAGG